MCVHSRGLVLRLWRARPQEDGVRWWPVCAGDREFQELPEPRDSWFQPKQIPGRCGPGAPPRSKRGSPSGVCLPICVKFSDLGLKPTVSFVKSGLMSGQETPWVTGEAGLQPTSAWTHTVLTNRHAARGTRE